mmetsp:Transcript_34175/g.50214  ORF Transcript_34175/g.50214 Transcript_34175/m.50214 type:complete len:117 (+) Transcript_34175:1797-2147(+)
MPTLFRHQITYRVLTRGHDRHSVNKLIRMVTGKYHRAVSWNIIHTNHLDVTEKNGENRMKENLDREIKDFFQFRNENIQENEDACCGDFPYFNDGKYVEEDFHWIDRVAREKQDHR